MQCSEGVRRFLAAADVSGHAEFVRGFPSRTEAAANLGAMWSIVKRPWFIVLVTLWILAVIALEATDNDPGARAAAILGAAFVGTALRISVMVRR